MILVDFCLDNPVLRDSFERAPDVRATWVRSNVDGDRVQVLFWATGGDLADFEAATAEDPTVAEQTVLTADGDRKLYRLVLAESGGRQCVYPVLVDLGGIVRHLEVTANGWDFRVEFPVKEAGSRFFEVCRDRDLRYEIGAIYDRRPDPGEEYVLTELQEEALVAALESGYLEIPRESSLADLAAELDISPNAASERFRRGVRCLLEQTVGQQS